MWFALFRFSSIKRNVLKNSIKIEENIKKLHEMGITGEGVTIAVIDSGFQAENHIGCGKDYPF